MGTLGMGRAITRMKSRIRQLEAELEALGEPEAIPEMIQSTNLLRANEHLDKSNRKKSELLAAYGEYSAKLEGLVMSMFEIQDELKDILRAQSELLAKRRRTGGRKA